MNKTLKKEFKKRQFGFSYSSPRDFTAWAWGTSSKRICGYFLIYRALLAAVFLSILVAYSATSEYPNYYFIYLTNLGYALQTLHLIVSAAVPVQCLLYSFNYSENTRWTLFAKFSWFLYNATNVLTIVISVVYWSVLYEPGSTISARNFLVHGLNSIVSIMDVFLSARPCRIMHFYHPFVILLAYTAFSAIYWAAGGRTESGLSYIYPVLNWENLGLTVPFVTIGLFVIVPLLQVFIWSLHLLRDNVIFRRNRRKEANPDQSSHEGVDNFSLQL